MESRQEKTVHQEDWISLVHPYAQEVPTSPEEAPEGSAEAAGEEIPAEASHEVQEAPKKRRGGRPKQKRVKSSLLQIKIYPEEREFLDKMAEEDGTSLANLIRAFLYVAVNDYRFRDAIKTRLADVFR